VTRVILVKRADGSGYRPGKIDEQKIVCAECDKLLANESVRAYEQSDGKVVFIHEHCDGTLIDAEPLTPDRIHSDSLLSR
jgi:hypothetical protein